jgi:hypothetical protein
MSIIFLITGTACLIQCFNKGTSHKWMYWVGFFLSAALFTGLKNGGY